MSERTASTPSALLGAPDEVMQPARLAMLPPTRLSASRSFVNKMIRERWLIDLVRLDIDERSRGEALYRITAGDRVFEFMVFSFEPRLEGRTGRIIGTAWDMTGSLVEGIASDDDVAQTRRELPKLYAGRAGTKTLVWCRSNRSLRAFDHTVQRLSEGRQPDVAELASIGYLMRNTGLDGNGTFGTRSYLSIEEGHPLRAPYHAQMLAAYIMREFSFDLAQHLARMINPRAPELAPSLRRYLGLGNGSALGLVFFINNHPILVDRWLTLRERALDVAFATPAYPGSPVLDRLRALISRAIVYHEQDPLTYVVFAKPKEIASGLRQALDSLATQMDTGPDPETPASVGEVVGRIAVGTGRETVEVLRSLAIELVPDKADDLVTLAGAPEIITGTPQMTVRELRDVIADEYAWALRIDLAAEGARTYVWYKSRDAEEPRRGPGWEVDGGYNWALDLPGDVQRIMAETSGIPSGSTVGEFLASHPGDRAAVQRIQSLRGLRFHSPHMNMMDAAFIPVQVIRLMNSAFHGLDKTVDYLDRNVLGLLFHGAPTRDDLRAGWAGDWFWPAEPAL